MHGKSLNNCEFPEIVYKTLGILLLREYLEILSES